MTPKFKKISSVSYIPIPGSGLSQKNSWENINGTEFYLNTADYPSLTKSYFEISFKLLNGNGIAFARLFDVTDGIEVWGSDASTRDQQFTTIVSAPLTLRPGNHLYRIQLKSLTADTAILNSARIKMLSEN